MIVKWKSSLDKGIIRTDENGAMRITLLISDVNEKITLKTNKFEKIISLRNGNYEIWLSPKECYE